MSVWMMACALVFALIIDVLLGEPPARWHPVVWMGNGLCRAGQWAAPLVTPAVLATEALFEVPPASDWRAFSVGALVWIIGAGLSVGVACGVQMSVMALLAQAGWLACFSGALLLGLALKPLLACQMLFDEVQAVESALAESLAAGRARLAWLVSRDVSALSESEVRESAIESLAENLNDSVVAPIFWFVLLGLPGAALYRFANTADAMWGYRGVRGGRVWEWAGKWAARADDVLSWLPARLTAVLLMGAGMAQDSGSSQGARSFAGWRVLPGQARLTSSPNSGWPMAAMALVLGVRLGKPGAYTLCAVNRRPEAADTGYALSLAKKAVLWLVIFALLAIQLIAFCVARHG